MKTVAEFAKEIDVSVQTIYRRLNKVKQINDEGLTVKKDGITYITSLGEDALTGRLTDVKQSANMFNGSTNQDQYQDQDQDVNMFNSVKRSDINAFNTVEQEGDNTLKNAEQKNISAFNSVKQSDVNEFNRVKQPYVNAFNDVEQVNNNEFNSVKHNVKHPESADITYFKEQNRILQEELIKEREHSRTQADRLASLAEQLAELSRNNQILLGAEQSRTNPALLSAGEQAPEVEEQPVRKKGFWGLFKK